MFNKDKMKGFLIGVVLTAIFSISFSSFAASVVKQIKVTYNSVKIKVDGKQVTLKDSKGKTLEPFSYNSNIYLPIDVLAKVLGRTITWDKSTNIVSISGGQKGTGFANRQDPAQMKEKVKTILTSMVKAGTITQVKADKLLTYYNTTAGQGKTTTEKSDPLVKAVTDGVITQAQADAIKKELIPAPKTTN